jgi:multiple antibiotic resistance protein
MVKERVGLANLVGLFILFLQGFILLFAIFDPIGTIPIFYSLTSKLTHEERRKVIRESILVAFAILIVFAYFGWIFLRFLGVTINDFRIAGGVLLFILAITDLMLERGRFRTAEPEEYAVVPLATPLLAGPGSITTVMIMTPSNPVITLLVIVANVIVAWVLFVKSEFLLRILGKNGMRVITRIMGLIVAALAVMFIREGILGIIGQV